MSNTDRQVHGGLKVKSMGYSVFSGLRDQESTTVLMQRLSIPGKGRRFFLFSDNPGKPKKTNKEHKRGRKCKGWLQKHYALELTLTEAAEHFCSTKQQLANISAQLRRNQTPGLWSPALWLLGQDPDSFLTVADELRKTGAVSGATQAYKELVTDELCSKLLGLPAHRFKTLEDQVQRKFQREEIRVSYPVCLVFGLLMTRPESTIRHLLELARRDQTQTLIPEEQAEIERRLPALTPPSA